jgi:hypothetical protein
LMHAVLCSGYYVAVQYYATAAEAQVVVFNTWVNYHAIMGLAFIWAAANQ